MIIDNLGNSMIKFRLKQKTYSRIDDIVLRDKAVARVVKRLDSNNVYNYGLSINIPDDVISINYGSNKKVVVNVPLSLNQYQYDIEDYFIDSKPRIRYNTIDSRNLIRFSVKDLMNEDQIYKLIMYIIKEIGYVVICPESKF